MHAYLEWLTAKERDLAYSVGFGFTTAMVQALALIPEQGWTRSRAGPGAGLDPGVQQ